MSTKTLTVTEEAYKLLALQKNSNESFSEVIVRKFSPNVALKKLVGLLSDKEADELEMRIAQNRKLSTQQSLRRIKEIREALSK